MKRKKAGTPETPAQEEKVNLNVFRWESLSELDPENGIGFEVKRLKGFAALFSAVAIEGEGQGVCSDNMSHVSFLLDGLLDDLEEGIRRVITKNVEIEQEAQKAAAD